MSKTSATLFLGCLLTSEVRMHLAESPLWKERHFQPEAIEGLQEVRWGEQSYLGKRIEEKRLCLGEIATHDAGVRRALSRCCPAVDFDTAHLFLIPQILLH